MKPSGRGGNCVISLTQQLLWTTPDRRRVLVITPLSDVFQLIIVVCLRLYSLWLAIGAYLLIQNGQEGLITFYVQIISTNTTVKDNLLVPAAIRVFTGNFGLAGHSGAYNYELKVVT